MTDPDSSSDELRLPFIYVPYDQPESPDVAAFKARYPGWFSIPATFAPYPEPEEQAGTDPEPDTLGAPEDRHDEELEAQEQMTVVADVGRRR